MEGTPTGTLIYTGRSRQPLLVTMSKCPSVVLAACDTCLKQHGIKTIVQS